jgi:anionic cell wall polymer biosynthesis LytR-Cps2A-Psr (LCP) family protein
MLLGVSLVVIMSISAGVSSVWGTVTSWQSTHKIQSDRYGEAEAVLVVALDTRNDGTGGLPDTLMLVDIKTGSLESISREWTYSLLSPKQTLVEKYLGQQDCQVFCGVHGLFMYSQVADGGQSGALGALEFLRVTIASEYGLDNFAIVSFDLAWAKSFLKCIAPLELVVKAPIPVGGKPINGTLTEFSSYIPAGSAPLEGNDLFWFARARFGTSNSDRIQRQEVLVREILKQKSTWELATCGFTVQEFLVTDLKALEVLRLFSSAAKAKSQLSKNPQP